MEREIVERLREYFEKKEGVVLAFLFGSRARGLARKNSDWDIGVYFKPHQYMEIETLENYDGERDIWGELVDILKTDDVSLAILNRTSPSVVFSVLRKGIPLVIKNRGLYLDLLCRVSYEAIDFMEFAFDFWEISEKAKSLAKEDRLRVLKTLKFLEKEWEDFDEFQKMTGLDYLEKSYKRRDIERWIENLAMASLDIAKIILASERELIPDSYKDTLRRFTIRHFDERFADRFSKFAEFTNIIVHEYLDIKWIHIKNFIKEAGELYPLFIKRVKDLLEIGN